MSGRIHLIGGALAAATLLSGCGSVTSAFNSTASGSAAGVGSNAQASAVTPPTPELDCPSVEVRAGASTLTLSAGKPNENGTLDLRYQGSIVRTARECQANAGVVSLRVGIEGRIVLGPAGGPGTVDVPMRIAVVEEGPNPKTIATKLYRTSVAIAPDQPNTNFSYVAEDLSFPLPRPGDLDRYVIYLGFDPQAEPVRPARKPPARRARSQS